MGEVLDALRNDPRGAAIVGATVVGMIVLLRAWRYFGRWTWVLLVPFIVAGLFAVSDRAAIGLACLVAIYTLVDVAWRWIDRRGMS
jgi:hypothetical protein